MPMLKDLIAFEMLLLAIIMVLVLMGMQLVFYADQEDKMPERYESGNSGPWILEDIPCNIELGPGPGTL